jgi:hypothetical protein
MNDELKREVVFACFKVLSQKLSQMIEKAINCKEGVPNTTPTMGCNISLRILRYFANSQLSRSFLNKCYYKHDYTLKALAACTRSSALTHLTNANRHFFKCYSLLGLSTQQLLFITTEELAMTHIHRHDCHGNMMLQPYLKQRSRN